MHPGVRRRQLDRTLRVAYGEGLLSDSTFADRVDHLLGDVAVDPAALVGDLTLRAPHGARRTRWRWPARRPLPLLALDWSGAGPERLTVGRTDECDVLLSDLTVSRRHAELLWRAGAWIVHDLGSRNGTFLNDRAVRRAQLRPGDRLAFAVSAFRVD